MTAGLKPEKEKRDRVLQMKFDEDVVTPHELPDLHGDVRMLLYDAINFSNLAAAIFEYNRASAAIAGILGSWGVNSSSSEISMGFAIGDNGSYYAVTDNGSRISVGTAVENANEKNGRLGMMQIADGMVQSLRLLASNGLLTGRDSKSGGQPQESEVSKANRNLASNLASNSITEGTFSTSKLRWNGPIAFRNSGSFFGDWVLTRMSDGSARLCLTLYVQCAAILESFKITTSGNALGFTNHDPAGYFIGYDNFTKQSGVAISDFSGIEERKFIGNRCFTIQSWMMNAPSISFRINASLTGFIPEGMWQVNSSFYITIPLYYIVPTN